MGNVVQFTRKTPKKEVKREANPHVIVEPAEYQLYSLMLTASVMFQTQRFDIGERILSCCRAAGYQQWVYVDDDLQEVIDATDVELAMFGPEEEGE